jgi:hypothetical protein
MSIFESIQGFLRRNFTPQATIDELDSELRIRRPDRDRPRRRKTLSGATHKHREPGKGQHRRAYLPASERRLVLRQLERRGLRVAGG